MALFGLVRGASKAAQPVIREGLKKLGGYSKPGSWSDYVTGLKQWVNANPSRASILGTVLAEAGIYTGFEVMQAALGDEAAAAAMEKIDSIYARASHNLSGDRDPDVVDDIDKEDHLASVMAMTVAHGKIQEGIRAAGSLSSLLAIRDAIAVDPVHYDTYTIVRG